MSCPTAVSSNLSVTNSSRAPACFDLVDQDGELGLVAGEPIDGVGEHDVGRAVAQQAPDALDARPVEREAAGRVADRLDDAPALLPGEVEAGALLGVERGAVPLLGIGRDSAVDDRAHPAAPTKS